MSKEYRTFEEWWEDADLRGFTPKQATRVAWHARDAELSAILAQFEALAGKWKGASNKPYCEDEYYAAGTELSALIQSVKERM